MRTRRGAPPRRTRSSREHRAICQGRAAQHGVPAGLEGDLPRPGVVGPLGIRQGHRDRLAPPGPRGADAGEQPAARARPGCHRQGAAPGLPGRDALLRALLDGSVPAAHHHPGADPAGHEDQPGGRAGAGRRQIRPRGDLRAAAHGQLGSGRGLLRRLRGPLRHRGRAAQAGVGVRHVRRLPREPGHGGAPADRRPQRVRGPGPAAAPGRADLPALRPGPDRERCRGRVLRGPGPDGGRAGRPGHPDRRLAAGGDAVVHRGGLGGRRQPGHPGPGRGGPQGQGRGHDPGTGPSLRAGHRRAPGRLAHAAAGVHRRPRPEPAAGRGQGRRRPRRGGRVMRIGLVCPYTWDVPGGVQSHIRDLAEALIEQGHYVSVISPADEDAPLPPYVVSAGRPVSVPYNGSVARLSFGFLSASRVHRWVKEHDFDVLHVHEPTAPSLSMSACWVASGPIVATVHTAMPKSRVLHAALPLIRSAMEKINGRIAVSEAARTMLVEHMGGDAVLIPNGVATRRYAGPAQPLPGWPGDGGAIGFLGRMDEPRQGPPVLLEAFAILGARRSGLRLLIAGPGDEQEVLDRVPPALRDRVVLLGQVSDEDKVRMLHSVDVFCAPNTGGESFGIVLAEAMAAGAPIVASDLDAFRRVLRGGRAGELFVNEDPADLARAAGRLLDDPERRRELSAAATVAVSVYDWSVVAKDVVNVYETVVLGANAVAVAT